jgi:hypothetical protein
VYGIVCAVLGVVGILVRHPIARWFDRIGLPGDTPTNVYWGRVVLPSALLVVVGVAMAVTG